MSFYYYNANSFPNTQNMQIFPTYTTQMSTLFPTMQFDMYSMMQYFQPTQNDFIGNLPEPKCSNVSFRDLNDHQEYEVVVQVKNIEKVPKRRQKKTVQKQISSAKKNSQSNIVNQFYSFFGCQQKSQKIVSRAIEATQLTLENQQKIITLFYNTVRAINAKRGRKYVNRAMMLNYFTPDLLIQNLPQIKQKLDKLDYITLEQLCQIFRRCSQGFLKYVSISAILTSKRITGISKGQHFKKRRKILKAIAGC